jgi:hypothetical protein
MIAITNIYGVSLGSSGVRVLWKFCILHMKRSVSLLLPKNDKKLNNYD